MSNAKPSAMAVPAGKTRAEIVRPGTPIAPLESGDIGYIDGYIASNISKDWDSAIFVRDDGVIARVPISYLKALL